MIKTDGKPTIATDQRAHAKYRKPLWCKKCGVSKATYRGYCLPCWYALDK